MNLVGDRLLTRNAALNLAGQLAPLAVALVAIPVLIDTIGTERFGFLAIAWMAIGYFSLFDLGLGRALTHAVSDRLGAQRDAEIPSLIWTALFLMLSMGGVALGSVYLLAGLAIDVVLSVPDDLRVESTWALRILALSLPFVIVTAGLRGVLESYQRFGVINAIRVPMGVLTFAGPLAVLPFSTSLVPIVTVLAVGRILAALAHLHFCLRSVPSIRTKVGFQRAEMPALLRYGGWVTVSNVVSPMMVYLDRFLIGAVLSMSAVAYYVTPYEVITRLWLIPSAMLGVFFPAFAHAFAHDDKRAAELINRSARAILIMVLPACLVAGTLAHEALSLWVGNAIAVHAAPVLRWLALGVFVNCVAHVPFALLQGAGRPDLPAKLHLVEVVAFLPLLWFLTVRFGITGAAAAWTLRTFVDAGLLGLLARRWVTEPVPGTPRVLGWVLAGAAAVIIGSLLPETASRVIYLAVALPLGALLMWKRGLMQVEREAAGRALKRVLPVS